MRALVYTVTQELEFRDEPDPVAGGQDNELVLELGRLTLQEITFISN